MLTLNSLEALPIINKLPLKTKEKRLLGLAAVCTLSFVFAAIAIAIILKVTTPKEKPAIEIGETVIEKSQIAYDSTDIEGFKSAVQLLMTSDSMYKAGIYLEKILNYNDNDTFALKRMVIVLNTLEKNDEAKLFLDKLLLDYPSDCSILKLEILLLPPQDLYNQFTSGKYSNCMKDASVSNLIAKKLLSTAPETAKNLLKDSPETATRLYLVEAKEMLKKNFAYTPEVEILLKKAAQNNPLQYESHLLLGQLLLEVKKVDEAHKELTIAKRLAPDNHLINYQLGILHFKHKNEPIKAAEFFEAALKETPSHWESALQMGLIFQRSKKTTGAIHYFNKALNYQPDNVRILLQLAAAYESAADKEQAIETYKSILRYDNQNDHALYKIKILKKD